MESIVKNFEENIESILEDFNENSRGYAWYDLNEAFANESFFYRSKSKGSFHLPCKLGNGCPRKFSYSALCEYYIQNKTDFENLRKKVENRTNKECPPFKLLDLVLWSAASANNGDESEE